MIDGPVLAKWINKHLANGKHCLILVEGFDCEDVARAISLEIPQAQFVGTVDLMVGEHFVCVRTLLSKMPRVKDRNVAMCMIRESNDE